MFIVIATVFNINYVGVCRERLLQKFFMFFIQTDFLRFQHNFKRCLANLESYVSNNSHGSSNKKIEIYSKIYGIALKSGSL
jgi:hypothetical protein